MSKNKVFKNSIYYMLAALLPSASGFLLLPLYTRFLTPSDYGILALVQAFQTFLPMVVSLQVHSSVGRFFFEYEGEELRRFLSTIALTLLIVSAGLLSLLYLKVDEILAFVFPKTPEHHYFLFRLVLGTVFFSTFNTFFQILLRVRELARRFMVLSTTVFLLGLVVNLVLVVVLERQARGIVEAGLVTSVIGFVVYLAGNFRLFAPRFDLSMLKEPLKYSLPIIPHSVAGFIFMYSDRVVMEKYLGLALIGLYALSDKISTVFKLFVNQINSAFSPHFIKSAKRNRDTALEELAHIAEVTICLTALGITIGALFAPEATYYLLDKDYFTAWMFFPLLSSSYVFRSLYCFSSVGLFFERKTGRISLITIAAGLVNIIFNIILIPRYGVVGAVVSTVAAFLVTYLLAVVFSARVFPVKFNNKRHLLYVGYMYSAIILSFFINSGFTIESPSLPLGIYVIKFVVLFIGIGMGFLFVFSKRVNIKKVGYV